ncbi:hypothetical protein CC80DRAFT_504933 [Byssothecium circinans]|uniref:Uncharacterized protein n=1 Tax=Byssothecium circinans TaxID=147558 RepID=A0A6A5TUQ8_9PLEO|nr:hypothetical protein CC80DRAFT_504933 [Byssothecium circinans]
MAEATNKFRVGTEEYSTAKEGISNDSSLEELTSALPPEAVASRQRAHDEVFSALSPESITAAAADTVPLLAGTMPNHHDQSALSSVRRQSRWNWALQVLQQWLVRCLAKTQPVARASLYDAIFNPIIVIGIEIGHDRWAQADIAAALIDPQCQHNLISRRLAERLFEHLDPIAPYPIVVSLNGSVNAIKKVKGRWQGRNQPHIANPWLRFGDVMEDAEFHVLEGHAPFDVIIGRRDIVRLDLLNLEQRPALAAAHFRSYPPPVDAATTQSSEAAAAMARQAEREQRRRDDEWRIRKPNVTLGPLRTSKTVSMAPKPGAPHTNKHTPFITMRLWKAIGSNTHARPTPNSDPGFTGHPSLLSSPWPSPHRSFKLSATVTWFSDRPDRFHVSVIQQNQDDFEMSSVRQAQSLSHHGFSGAVFMVRMASAPPRPTPTQTPLFINPVYKISSKQLFMYRGIPRS